MLEEYIALYAQSKEIETRMKALKDEFLIPLTDAGTVELTNGRVSVTTMPGRKTFDKKAAKAAGVDIAAYEKVGRPFQQLNVEIDDGGDT